jgi:hypothetical protein
MHARKEMGRRGAGSDLHCLWSGSEERKQNGVHHHQVH